MQTLSTYTAAAGNTANITPGGGVASRRMRLHSITVSGSVAGRYQVFDNSNPVVALYDGKLAASTPLTLTYGNSTNDGYVTVDPNVSVSLFNQTGGVSDLGMTIVFDYVGYNAS